MGKITGFNPADVPDEDGFAPLPAGVYAVMIDEVDIVQSDDPEKAAKAGEMIKLKMIVNPEVHPDIGKRSIYCVLCYQHTGETARKIAQRHLASICRALELEALDDTEELLGGQLRVRVKVGKETDQYRASNEVTAFLPLEEASETPAQKKAAAAPKPATTTASTKPGSKGKAKPSWA